MEATRSISALVFAGGTGGSFSPISVFMPKSLAFVGTKPIVHHIIDSISSLPITTLYVLVDQFGEMIERYVADTESIKSQIEFVRSRPGNSTAGCLLQARDTEDEYFLTHFGDVLTEGFDFPELLRFHYSMEDRHGILGTLAYSRAYPIGVGIFEIDRSTGLLLEAKEKPTEELNVNMAIALFNRSILDYIDSPGEDLYGTVIPRALAQGREFAVFEHKGSWWHIHTVADLYKAHVDNYAKWSQR